MIVKIVNCRYYQAQFSFKNRLHQYLKSQKCQLPKTPLLKFLKNRLVKHSLSKLLTKLKSFANYYVHVYHAIEIIQSIIIVRKIITTKTFNHFVRPYYYLRTLIKLDFQTITKLIY